GHLLSVKLRNRRQLLDTLQFKVGLGAIPALPDRLKVARGLHVLENLVHGSEQAILALLDSDARRLPADWLLENANVLGRIVHITDPTDRGQGDPHGLALQHGEVAGRAVGEGHDFRMWQRFTGEYLRGGSPDRADALAVQFRELLVIRPLADQH